MIAKLIIVAWFAVNALLTVSGIGKRSQPTTPGGAAIAVAIYAGLIGTVLAFWH